jgi:hypothetical protein
MQSAETLQLKKPTPNEVELVGELNLRLVTTTWSRVKSETWRAVSSVSVLGISTAVVLGAVVLGTVLPKGLGLTKNRCRSSVSTLDRPIMKGANFTFISPTLPLKYGHIQIWRTADSNMAESAMVESTVIGIEIKIRIYGSHRTAGTPTGCRALL